MYLVWAIQLCTLQSTCSTVLLLAGCFVWVEVVSRVEQGPDSPTKEELKRQDGRCYNKVQ